MAVVIAEEQEDMAVARAAEVHAEGLVASGAVPVAADHIALEAEREDGAAMVPDQNFLMQPNSTRWSRTLFLH